MRAAALVLCACLAMLVAACGGSGGDSAPDVAARSLVLKQQDVPPLYESNDTLSGPVSNEEVASGRPEGYADRLDEWGRVEGYSAQYLNDLEASPNTGVGQRSIDSLASVYEDADGASESFAAGLQGYKDADFKPAGTVRLGDDARAFRGSATLDGKPVEYLVVTWRRGPIISSVVTSAPPRKVSLALVERLARKQDQRIARELADAA
jgi:hypothetical protein